MDRSRCGTRTSRSPWAGPAACASRRAPPPRNEVVPADRLIDEVWAEDSPSAPPARCGSTSRGFARHSPRTRWRPDRPATSSGWSQMTWICIGSSGWWTKRGAAGPRPGGRRGRAAAGSAVAVAGPTADGLRVPEVRPGGDRPAGGDPAGGARASIDADLALGRQDELVGEIKALVAEQPLRERLCGHLMTALYRSGRQVEALDAYRDARRALVDGLGISRARLQGTRAGHPSARAGVETAGGGAGEGPRGRGAFDLVAISTRRAWTRCSPWPSRLRDTRLAP